MNTWVRLVGLLLAILSLAIEAGNLVGELVNGLVKEEVNSLLI